MMSSVIDYLRNTASEAEVAEHLSRCDSDFVPALSERVEIRAYARKIVSKAIRFEAWSGGELIGLVAAYCNDLEKRIAYITSVSMLREWTGRGIAAHLVGQCAEYVKACGMQQIQLEVASANWSAIRLYEKAGFAPCQASTQFVTMTLHLTGLKEHEQQT